MPCAFFSTFHGGKAHTDQVDNQVLMEKQIPPSCDDMPRQTESGKIGKKARRQWICLDWNLTGKGRKVDPMTQFE